jgi:hypothetical protein
MRSLGRQFGWLWVAFAVSTFGTWLAFDAFALIAIIVLHSGPTAVAALAAGGQRHIPEDAGAAGGPAGCEQPVRVHDLVGIGAIRGREPPPALADTPRLRVGDVFEGWRYILSHRTLRPLFFNTALVNGLIMATSPLIAVLMLGQLGFKPWQYGLAFGLPCIGGLIGSRLARTLVARFGQHKVMFTAGAMRACWSVGLAFIHPGISGIVLIIAVQFGLVTRVGVFNPVFVTYRLDQTETHRIARTLSAWSVTSNITIAALTALWGLLAGIIGPRAAIAIAGILLLATPLLLPRCSHPLRRELQLAPDHS